VENQYLALEAFNKPKKEETTSTFLKGIFSNNEWLNLNFDSFSVSTVGRLYTLVPNALFAEKEMAAYGHLALAESNTSHLRHISGKSDFSIIFSNQNEAVPFLKEKIPTAKFFPHSLVLLDSLIPNSNEELIAVNIHDDLFDLAVIRERKLIFSNTFQYRSKEDYLYFLLFALEQLKINAENLSLTIYGKMEKASQLSELTAKYVKETRFGKLPDKFRYSYKFKEIPEHYFFNLLSQFLCV